MAIGKHKKNGEKRALTISEAAAYSCVSEATIRNWVQSRIIPFEELPSRGNGSHKFRLIRKSDLDAFLDNHYKHTKNYNIKNNDKLILLPSDGL